jgi:hypothetical protein
MTVDESKALNKGTRVDWRGNAADSGIITETSWDAVTIAWNNGQVGRVYHGDMREIQQTPTKSQSVTPTEPTPLHHSTKPRHTTKPSIIRDVKLESGFSPTRLGV